MERPELAEAIDPEDLTGNDDDPIARPTQPNDKPEVTVAPNVAKPAVEDVQMKKALELLRESRPAITQRAA